MIVVEVVDTIGAVPVPGWAYTLHLLAHPVQVLALLLLVKRRGQGDRAAWLDAALLALTVFALVWGLVLDLGHSAQAGPLAVFLGPFPTAAGIAIVAVMLRVVLVTGRDGALLLLLAAMVAAAAADIGNNIAARTIPVQLDGWVDAMWMAGFTLTLAAALHPRASRITNEQPPDAGGLGTLRIVALAIGALLIPSLLVLAITGAMDQQVHALGVDERRGDGDRARPALAGRAGAADPDPIPGGPGQDRCPHRAGEPPDLGVPGRTDRQGTIDGPHTTRVLAMADLDYFKAFNDAHGHRSGDEMLRRCAVAWREALGTGPFLARYGGEEFALTMLADSADRRRRTSRRSPASHSRPDDRLDRRDGMAGRRIGRIRGRARRSGAVRGQEPRP